MRDKNERVQELEPKSKRELMDLLAEELNGAYNGEITDSLRNDFMRACYERMDVDDSPFVKVQSHENYSSSWSTKKQLATALRMVLTERVGHPEHDGITSLNKRVLAELITAIQQGSESEVESNKELTEDVSAPPTRDGLPPRRFEDRLPAEKFHEYALYEWILSNRSETDGEHGVYVLDCTPPVREDEDFRVASLRTEVQEKVDAGHRLSKLEQAADALNNSERLYYVGYASDVPKRIREHLSGADSGGAKFTNMFAPQGLVDVTWFETERSAREYEPRRAEELTVPDESFGYAE
jgi:hypothetical protein